MHTRLATQQTDPRWYFAVSRLFAVRLRVLVVTDGANDLADLSDSLLGQALHLRRAEAYAHHTFTVTTAHRASADADLPHFRFDRHDLRAYDQIWLWRTDRGGAQMLSSGELNALARFMERGGGVFAARS